MRFLEFLRFLSDLLSEASKRFGLPSLDVIAFRLTLFLLLCMAGIYMVGLAFKLLLKFYSRRSAPKIDFVAVLVGSLVSYVIWVAAYWFISFFFMIIFTGLDSKLPAFQLPEFLNWVALGGALIIHLISIGLIGEVIRGTLTGDVFSGTTRLFPRIHSCAVGLLFIAFDILVTRYCSAQPSFRQPIIFYAATLCAVSVGDFIFIGLLLARSFAFPTTWTPTSLFAADQDSPTEITDTNKLSSQHNVDRRPALRDDPIEIVDKIRLSPNGSNRRVFIVTPEGSVSEKRLN